MAVVGIREISIHHHHVVNLFCCRMRLRKKNKNENFTLITVMPSIVEAESCNFSSCISWETKSAGPTLDRKHCLL